uniref:DNA restriction enzyme subunit n=1 Tax=Tetragenococcus muriaticus TaxID=64642 RepID=I7HD61_9ENTE|nr:DEAD/DEAH box helicase family protein [Tetragenococcus muriaticus]BAM28810.1 DNA restriction enzyme subunit [Tetragenococcus muriaticus]
MNELLHSKIQQRFQQLFELESDYANVSDIVPDIPSYIQDNLHHNLRPYQEGAIRQLIYTQRSDAADMSYNHLLFHMATGSGKTLVLAATILYLYGEHQQQNFIFFVNSDAIIKKTYDNLTNQVSPKYLFARDGIEIDGERVTIQIVDTFPANPAVKTIYLKLTTIQKLHMDLTNPRENGLTYEALEETSIVLLADEAHHINALTRNDKKTLNKKELQEKTWEHTVQRLLNLHPNNRLFEYTATIDWTNDALFHKYSDKVVYQYDLKRFMQDGYSKNVVLLRANEEDSVKMIDAILLSQYRKYIANDHGIDLKPIILFKSNKIATSKEANAAFFKMVAGLTVNQLEQIIQHGMAVHASPGSIWHKMFQYYAGKELPQVVRDLQWEFTEETTINANSQDFLEEQNALLLNTLEDTNNPIRTIFAVAKLNEGWDVLNLFDIVRISEGATGTKATTDSEAQLIGRGARYYPFEYEGEKTYTRRFDEKPSDLKVLEALHYHTINDNAYIKNLEKSLEAARIEVKKDEYYRLQAKVKGKVKRAEWFQNGKIYINKVVPTTEDDYQDLRDYNISTDYEVDYERMIEQRIGEKETMTSKQTHEQALPIDRRLIQKAIQRNKFYRFSHLKQYVPAISSMKEFIESKDFLGDLSIWVSLPVNVTTEDLSPCQKLKIVERFLDYAVQHIRSNYMKVKGTPYFEGYSFSELIDDYVVELSKVTKATDITKTRNMKGQDWYIYDQAIGNHLEHDFIDLIQDYVETLQEKYEDVYLIRNERKVKITEIDGTRGFMPDFLLYMKDEDYTYQVFLEPKGEHLLLKDQWKEEFLKSLNTREDLEILSENEQVRLIGLRFYTNDAARKVAFKKDFQDKLT